MTRIASDTEELDQLEATFVLLSGNSLIGKKLKILTSTTKFYPNYL